MQNLKSIDWKLIKGSTLLSLGTVVSRVLGMAFSLVLANAFVPEEYGAIRYVITLSMLFSVATQPFGQHVLARFIGKHKHDEDELQRTLSNAWFLLLVLLLVTLVITVVALLLIEQQVNVGVLAIVLGVSVYYAYWGLCRGFGAEVRLAGVSVGSNVVQLAVVAVAVYVLDIRSAVLAMVVFGLSYFVPIILLQLFWPLSPRFNLSFVRWENIREILRFSGSIWGSHVGYVFYNSIVVLLLERFSGTAAIGIYALANTLARSFLFIPDAISTLLMPRIAAAARHSHAAMTRKLLVLSLAVNGVLLIAYLGLVKWFVTRFFGADYFAGGITVYAIMAAAMIVLGVHGVVTAVLVGQDKAGIETVSRILALIATATTGWLLIPKYEATGAAIAMTAGSLTALTYYVIILLSPSKKQSALPTHPQ